MDTPETDAAPLPARPHPDAPANYYIEFTYAEGLRGWLEAKWKSSPLYGRGTLLFEVDGVVLQGWQRSWLGAAQRTEIRIARTEIKQATREDAYVRLEFRRAQGNLKHLRFRAESADQANAVIAQLLATRVELTDPAWADLRNFNERLDSVTPRAFVTHTLIALNVLGYIATAITSKNVLVSDPVALTAWGSNLGMLTLHGEWWRLLTCMFLHGGLLHLLFNMWALWGAGRMVERLYGNWIFLILYLLSGILASIASVAWQPLGNSVGASGAIFGVLGAYLAFLAHAETRVPRTMARAGWLGTAIFVAYNLINGMTQTGIDNAAHVGGLLAGFVLGWLLARPVDARARETSPTLLVIACVSLTAAVALTAFGNLGAFKPAGSASARFWLQHKWYLTEETESFRTLDSLQSRAAAGSLSDEEAVRVLKKEIVPFWARAEKRLAKEKPAADADVRTFAAALAAFVHERALWSQAFLDSIENRDSSRMRDAQKFLAEAENARARIERLDLRGRAANRPPSLSNSKVASRLRRAFTRRSTCIGKQGALLKSSAAEIDPSDGPAARAKAGCDAQSALAAGDVAALEAMFQRYSASLADLPDGGSSLSGFETGLEEFLTPERDLDGTMQTIADWRRHFPTSTGPDLFEAELFQQWAWMARGHGFAKSVTPQAFQLFEHRLEMAATTLKEIESRAAGNPLWYADQIFIGVDRSQPREALRALFDRGATRFPQYMPLHRGMLRALQPRWGGSIEDVDRFINDVHMKTQPRLGFEMYARLYWTFASMEEGSLDLFTDTLAEWTIMRHGFQDLVKHHPHSPFLQNGFARFACQAHDWASYGAARAGMGKSVWDEVWPKQVTVAGCDKEAKAAAARKAADAT